MVFPVVELKFSAVNRTDTTTQLDVSVYVVRLGALTAHGQQYDRTLIYSGHFGMNALVSDEQIVAEGRERLKARALDRGVVLPDARLICDL